MERASTAIEPEVDLDHGIREESDRPEVDSGDDAGGDRRDQEDAKRSAEERIEDDARGHPDFEHGEGSPGSGGGQEDVRGQVACWRVPGGKVLEALRLGLDVGIAKVVHDTGDETVDQLVTDLVAGRQQFWSITEGGTPKGTMITQIVQRPATRALVVTYLAGDDMPSWAEEATRSLDAFARQAECDGIEAIGREGLRKRLLQLGWAKVAVVYRRSPDG